MRGQDKLYTAICAIDAHGKAHMISRVRPEVADFAVRMEAKLASKDGKKTHWRELPPEALMEFLEIEIRELSAAMKFLSVEEQMGEAVDVANYALILWDRLRALTETAGQPPGYVPSPESTTGLPIPSPGPDDTSEAM